MYLWRKKKVRAQRAESPAPFALCTEKPKQGQSAAVLEQVSTTVPKSAILRFCPSRETCWGVPSPNPAMRLAPYGISQSEFLRQAIRRTTIRPIIHVSAVNDELLSAVGKLAAEYGRIGGNLNQIARYLNEFGTPYNALAAEVRAELSDLAALKFRVLREVGEAIGNTQAYQL